MKEKEQFLLHLIDIVSCDIHETPTFYSTKWRLDMIALAKKTFKPNTEEAERKDRKSKVFSERQLEAALCIGLLNINCFTVDKLSETLKELQLNQSEKLERIKNEIRNMKP